MKKKIFDYDRLSVGERIRKKRLLLGFTQDQLSEHIGRVPKYCADIERGSCGMSVETMIAFAEILNMSLDYLMFGKASDTELEVQKSEVLAIMAHLNRCPPSKRQYALDLLKLFLAACSED